MHLCVFTFVAKGGPEMVIPGNRKENFVSALQDYFCGGVGLAQTSPTYKHFNSYFDMKRYK